MNKVKPDQCVTVEICQHCDARKGRRHKYWCRFHKQERKDWTKEDDDVGNGPMLTRQPV